MDLAEAKPWLEGGIALLTFLGALYAAWFAVGKRIKAWWRPYREAVLNMQLVPELVRDVGEVKASVALLSSTVSARLDSDPALGYFECGPAGENIAVNETYARWTGCSEQDLLGWGFLNAIHPEDREPLRTEWLACIRDRRKYAWTVRFHRAGGGWFTGEITARPIPDEGVVAKWIGVIRRPEARTYEDDAA